MSLSAMNGVQIVRCASGGKSSSWPASAKAFHRVLQTRLDVAASDGKRRPLSKSEVAEVVRELEERVSNNNIGVASIASTLRAFGTAQFQLIKANKLEKRETYIEPRDKNNSPERYTRQFHPIILDLVSNFVRIMNKPQRDVKGTFSGTALNHVVYGMSTMGLKWKDLGEMQNPLLEALGLACATIRKQDLDFVMGKLGQMGLTWSAVPPRVREGIIRALHSHLSCSNSASSSSGGSTTSVHNTLYGMAQLSMSLTPEVCGSPLCEAVMRSVEEDVPSMEKWEFSRLLWDLGKLSGRGSMLLPASTLRAISCQLDRLVQPCVKVTGSSTGATEDTSMPPPPPPPPVHAEVRDIRNILWGLSTAGVTWGDLDPLARGNLLHLVRGCMEGLEGEDRKDSTRVRSQPRHHSAHAIRTNIASTLGRMRADLAAGDGSGDSVDDMLKEWLLSERGLLRPICTSVTEGSMIRELTPLLVGIANIVQSSTGKVRATNGIYNAHRQSIKKQLSSSQQENLARFLDAACEHLEKSLSVNYLQAGRAVESWRGGRGRARTGDAKGRGLKEEQRLVCNLVWALGVLGYKWEVPLADPRTSLGEVRSTRVLSPKLKGLLQKQLAELFKRGGDNEVDEDGEVHGPAAVPTAAAGSAGGGGETTRSEKMEEHQAARELSTLGYDGSSGGGSILPLLSTSTLSFSPLQSVGSFRELLYPGSAKFNQKDIYNWLGALAAVQAEYMDLPDGFRNALMVALAADISMQGPATAVQTAIRLSRCHLALAVSEGGRSGSSGAPQRDRTELPSYLVSELTRKLCSECSHMDPLQLLLLVEALGSGGLCDDLHMLTKHEHLLGGKSPSPDSKGVTHSPERVPLGVLLTRRLSQAIASSFVRPVGFDDPALGSAGTGQGHSRGPEQWQAARAISLIHHLNHLTWASSDASVSAWASWTSQALLSMHTSILTYLVTLPDNELHAALEKAPEEELSSLRAYLGLQEQDIAEPGLTQFPSLVEDALRLGERVDMYL